MTGQSLCSRWAAQSSQARALKAVPLWVALGAIALQGCNDPLLTEPPAPSEEQLGSDLNELRSASGLPPVAWSPALALVAREHVWDLERSTPIEPCNLHSWSNSTRWQACCYRDDSPDVACMTSKPGELTGYPGPGYEIAVEVLGSEPLSPERALELWMESPPHRAVILNEGPWADTEWLGMGVAITDHYAVVWFSDTSD